MPGRVAGWQLEKLHSARSRDGCGFLLELQRHANISIRLDITKAVITRIVYSRVLALALVMGTNATLTVLSLWNVDEETGTAFVV
jgi:hypothetical protein